MQVIDERVEIEEFLQMLFHLLEARRITDAEIDKDLGSGHMFQAYLSHFSPVLLDRLIVWMDAPILKAHSDHLIGELIKARQRKS